MSLGAKLRLLAEIIRTPIREVTPSSPLCQSYSVNEETKPICVKMLDKMKAMDMDNRLAGHYDDSIRIENDSPVAEFIAQIRQHNSASSGL